MNYNKRLDSSIYENQLLIVKKSNEIAGLTDRDLGLQKEVKTLENKINNLKSNYEKANNHADNFSSDQISRYFTDSLR
jgi:archaellum component FlaC